MSVECQRENKSTAFEDKLGEYLPSDTAVAIVESVGGSERLDSCFG